MKRPAFLLAALLPALIVALAFKGELVRAPEVPAGARGGEFDTARTLTRLHRILGDQRPHPVDSPANDAVRERLIAELRALGLAPRVMDSWACNGSPSSRTVSCARVRNVVATIGPAKGSHVLVASHYDSTATGPGAADDGIGVAVALETAALLKDGPLARPVTFLFDEGEEAGLLGAKAFLEHDPLAAHVDSVVNLEARGVTGPAIMFETSRPNGGAVAAYARAARRPVANSLTADIYRLIPNSTDVSVFAARPWTILNFAIIGNETRYHSAGDTLEALDPRSVRHMGIEAVAATRALASGPAVKAGGERAYADVLGRALISLPLPLSLAALAALLLAFGGIALTRRPGIGRAIGSVAAALLVSGGLTFLAQSLVGLLRAGEFSRGHPEVIAGAVDVSAVAASLAILAWVAKRLSRARLRVAFWLLFLLLGGALAFVAPGSSIFFLAPPAVGLAGIALDRRFPGAERLAALIAWGLLFLSWAPLLHLGEVLLGFAGAWIFAIVSALLALPVLIEAKPLLDRSGRATILSTAGVAALAAWIVVALAPAYSADRKQQFRIEYGWDQKSHKGQWLIASDGAPLPSAFPDRRAFREGVEVPWSISKRWGAPGPAVPLAPPWLGEVYDRPSPGGGRLIMRGINGEGMDQVLLRFEGDAGLIKVRMGGSVTRVGKGRPKDPFFVRCLGGSCDGGVIYLLATPPQPLAVTVIGIRFGLPPAAGPLVAARPATAQPQYSPDSSFAVDRLRF